MLADDSLKSKKGVPKKMISMLEGSSGFMLMIGRVKCVYPSPNPSARASHPSGVFPYPIRKVTSGQMPWLLCLQRRLKLREGGGRVVELGV